MPFASTPRSTPHSRSTQLYVPVHFLKAPWVQFVWQICSWMCGHSLELGRATENYIPLVRTNSLFPRAIPIAPQLLCIPLYTRTLAGACADLVHVVTTAEMVCAPVPSCPIKHCFLVAVRCLWLSQSFCPCFTLILLLWDEGMWLQMFHLGPSIP